MSYKSLKYILLSTTSVLSFMAAGQRYEGFSSTHEDGTFTSDYGGFSVAPKYDGFILPLEQEQAPQLSSGFGELRVTRFHAGIDFRTGGVEGVKVRSVADGHIYRIAVAPWGYGKVVYIQHAGGVQTVYAHLRDFTPELEEYVEAERYRRQSGAVNLFPPKGKFPVTRGQLIGYSGNTGSSGGPHLHFEVRDGFTDRTLNPISLGIYNIPDNIAPTILAVSYYVVDTVAGVPFHTLAGRYPAERTSPGNYRLQGNVKAPGTGYYAIEAYDRKNNVGFNMALYRITEKVDDQVRFEYRVDGFDFTQTGYGRTVGVYAENLKSKYDIIRLAVQDGGVGLPFYHNVHDRGLVRPDREDRVEIEVADDNGNVSTVAFDMEYSPEAYQQTVLYPTGAEVLDAARPFTKTVGRATVSIPARTLYESILYSQHELAEAPAIVKTQSGAVLSPFHAIHTESVPLHSSFTLSIGADVPEELRGKVVLARVSGNGNKNGERWLAATAAKYVNGYVTGKVSSFGIWCVAADTKPPAVTPSFGSGANLSKSHSLSFAISDNLSGVATYRAEIDGRWVILEHDVIKNRLIHNFDDTLTGTGKTHEIKLTVTDGTGNITVWTGKYFR